MTLQRWKAKATDLWLLSGRQNLLRHPKYRRDGSFLSVGQELDAKDRDVMERVEAGAAEALSDPQIEAIALRYFQEIQAGKRGVKPATLPEFEQFCMAYCEALDALVDAAIALGQPEGSAPSRKALPTEGLAADAARPAKRKRRKRGKADAREKRAAQTSGGLPGGMWACPSCAGVNSAGDRECGSCSEPAPDQ